jgi:hypothetical protein
LLPGIEEIDPSLALLDLEQRVVVRVASRLKLFHFFDLKKMQVIRHQEDDLAPEFFFLFVSGTTGWFLVTNTFF